MDPHTDIETPDYAIEILGNGDVTFEGKHSTKVSGTRHTKIAEEAVRALVDEAYRIDFFSYHDQYLGRDLGNGYWTTVNHAVGYWIQVDTAANHKTVYHFYGGPSELEGFKNRIAATGDPHHWRDAHFSIVGK